MRFNREELLSKLHCVKPGIAQKELLQQSSCVIFQKGDFFTYDDETSCQIPSGFPREWQGATKAATLIAFLEKFKVDEVFVNLKSGKLQIKCRDEEASFRVQEDIQLSPTNVEKPKEWKPLPEEFDDALKIVSPCAGSGSADEDYRMSCVHFHSRWIEASDGIQFARYRVITEVEQPFLIKQKSLKNITSLGVTEFSETENWVHFKNEKLGLILSSRRYLDEYENLSEIFKRRGEVLKLPEGLGESIDKADVFTQESARPKIIIELENSKMLLTGEGVHGKYTTKKAVDYTGEKIKFGIMPKILSELGKRYSQCEVTQDHIRVKGERFTYVSILYKNQEESHEQDDGDSV